ncbi:EamA family transporter [Leucothrix arctica]|uniref:4-amino-4-deoxy-L-arabinose-phospho-UDP flippase n=1 Tax=Leucothrix arctica TaxID=1481894 RepID=A0A317CBI5_9GAMM|nr:EamA family transporter [Leucothrix arctica]PWQ95727.1 4-amino-4-deoxy-L-arabinose-phospho-UDP flippase [Leucothrix arctica]
MSDLVIYIALFFSIVLSSVAQIFQKLAALRLDDNESQSFLRSPYVWLSFVCLGFGLVLWLVVLSELSVSQAYPMLSLSYIAVMLLARWLFKEHIPMRRWVGAAFIILGVSCLMGAT